MASSRWKVPYTDFPAQFDRERDGLIAAITSVLEKGDLILGDAVSRFEAAFGTLCGVDHAVGVGSGTDALVLALHALGIGAGDEVVTVPNSWISSASCIALVGARPVFVDVLPDMNIDPDKIEAAITDRTKAILPVHLSGRPARMDRIASIAAAHGLVVIEDAAQAVGALFEGQAVGSLGNVGCFSLHPLKNLNACGDAGIITCDDDSLHEKLRLLRNHGLVDRDHVDSWGFCSRLDSIQAAVLEYRLHDLAWVEARRRENATYYTENLADVVTTPAEGPGEHHVYHTYVIQTDQRDGLAKHLTDTGISTKVHYPVPIHLQKPCLDLGYAKGDFPETERLCDEMLTLPAHQFLSEAQRDLVVSEILSFFRRG
jgi:dTDP-4-amino-4,6-dideoxygalactose transaminase